MNNKNDSNNNNDDDNNNDNNNNKTSLNYIINTTILQHEEQESVVQKAEEGRLAWWAWEEVFQGVGESDGSGQSVLSRASQLAEGGECTEGEGKGRIG